MKDDQIGNTETEVASTPSPENNKDFVNVEKTEDVKSGKGSVVLGHIVNGNITYTNNPLPNKINPLVKPEVPKNIEKNKKRVNIVTRREKRMRTIISL